MTRLGLLLALLAAGCASAQPAPISYGGAGQVSPPRASAARPEPRPQQTPTPRPVQTPARAPQRGPDWAESEGTPLSVYALRPEDAQPYDPAHLPRTHRVGARESLSDIAERYQIPLRALAEQNRLEPPYALTPGRELELPPPRFHVASAHETLEDIARAFDVDARSLALLNRMQPPYTVRENDRIVLPAMARPWTSAPRAPATTASPANVAPAPTGPARFGAPLPGEIVARFGAQPGGGRLDGVEIAGREGEPIRAASDGEVVYAGTDLPSYGVLVLIRHADDYVTAYAYGRRALVRAGQTVRGGEPIAELGPRSDGRARVLFQVRRGREALDPLPLMGRAE